MVQRAQKRISQTYDYYCDKTILEYNFLKVKLHQPPLQFQKMALSHERFRNNEKVNNGVTNHMSR